MCGSRVGRCENLPSSREGSDKSGPVSARFRARQEPPVTSGLLKHGMNLIPLTSTLGIGLSLAATSSAAASRATGVRHPSPVVLDQRSSVTADSGTLLP